MDVVRQHVALGDAIVRDLRTTTSYGTASAITTSDGTATATSTGWPARRSRSSPGSSAWATPSRAMTTTRPYRKALTVRRALDRLLDAATTQLDESWCTEFINGIEHGPTRRCRARSRALAWRSEMWAA